MLVMHVCPNLVIVHSRHPDGRPRNSLSKAIPLWAPEERCHYCGEESKSKETTHAPANRR